MLDQLEQPCEVSPEPAHVSKSAVAVAAVALATVLLAVEYLLEPVPGSLVLGTLSTVAVLRYCEWPKKLRGH